MDEQELEGVISLTQWCIKDVENHRDIDGAIKNLKRIYGYLTNTGPED
jgi:hypothetical protein